MPTKIDMAKFAKFCKDMGFIFQSCEIYGGINGFWDYGPLGVELKKNIKDAWWQDMVRNPPPGPDGQEIRMVGLDCSIIMNPKVWVASGHAESAASTGDGSAPCGPSPPAPSSCRWTSPSRASPSPCWSRAQTTGSPPGTSSTAGSRQIDPFPSCASRRASVVADCPPFPGLPGRGTAGARNWQPAVLDEHPRSPHPTRRRRVRRRHSRPGLGRRTDGGAVPPPGERPGAPAGAATALAEGPDVPSDVAQLLAQERYWRAARRLRDLTGPATDPALLLVAAKTEAGWGGWENVFDLLEGKNWLDRVGGGDGWYLLGRAWEQEGEWNRAAAAYGRYVELQADTGNARTAASARLASSGMRWHSSAPAAWTRAWPRWTTCEARCRPWPGGWPSSPRKRLRSAETRRASAPSSGRGRATFRHPRGPVPPAFTRTSSRETRRGPRSGRRLPCAGGGPGGARRVGRRRRAGHAAAGRHGVRPREPA